MGAELQMLVATCGLLLVLTILQGLRNIFVLGLPTAAGNQDDVPPWTGAHDRLNRAIRNLMEAMAIFTPLVLGVVAAGASTETTATGAQIFFSARFAHAVLYTAGAPYLRTVAWAAGVAGTVMVGQALL